MRTPETVRRHLKHLREACNSDPIERQTWAAALEWALGEDEFPEITAGLTPFAELITAAIAARHALRSYQYGNASTELAAEIADSLDTAIRQALEQRDLDLQEFSNALAELQTVVGQLATDLKRQRP